MISTSRIKLIRSLEQKKQRERQRLYIVEGNKLVKEFLDADATIECVVATAKWLSEIKPTVSKKSMELIEATPNELKKISMLSTPQDALALVRIPDYTFEINSLKGELSIALDSVQDPGNLGTIIRIAAWYGIKNVFCSTDCVDQYNSKVIQASMGAILRVKVHYCALEQIIKEMVYNSITVYSASLGGDSVYQSDLKDCGLIIFGNESRGVKPSIEKMADKIITIPSFGEKGAGMDSLNVAMSAAIICSEFRRKQA